MPRVKQSTEISNWEGELAKQAEIAVGMEASTSGGKFFSLKSGVLSFNDAPFPQNQMAVVILDAILENVFYEGAFDPENMSGPACYAFGRNDAEMKPHEMVVKGGTAKCADCASCDLNQWGSADQRRGKACSNRRRLALISAGTFDAQGRFQIFPEKGHFTETEIGFLKIPPTAIKGYGGFVKSLAATLKRPPHGVFTKVSVVPDTKTQFRVMFEPLSKVPDNLMPEIMKRHEEAKGLIDFPYTPFVATEAPAKGKPGVAAPATGKKRKY